MRLVLLGLPGAGKGTQGERISAKYGIPHISTGSIIRSVIASGSKLGTIVNSYISLGNLIPDQIAIMMLKERIESKDCINGWILDGFPRTVEQAVHLDETIVEEHSRVEAFDIRISEGEAIRRVGLRRMCSKCGETFNLLYYRTKKEGICDRCGSELYQRTDDNTSVALQRLKVHMEQTHPVMHFYAQSGRLTSINGEQPIEDVFINMDKAFAKLITKYPIGDGK